ncbi:hypothetical protein DVT68_17275 [Dyella solisilvae]|uniref:Uncharacterized protein n=1 Tax=Dyella solisilvae TaxID=1920168 RepID=A0A370K4A3_9GAMM|nr:hypothetical protein [Dyella solisilvae]RDI97491.1 hypothetical protein DVT68_17275 [Dyella solisilvae]
MRTSLVFILGFVVGCIVGLATIGVMYYQHYFVTLDGPAGVVARSFQDLVSEVQKPIDGTARTAEEIADERLRLLVGESVLAADAFCTMNQGNRSATQRAAAKLQSNPLFLNLVSNLHREDARAAVEFIKSSPVTGQQCTVFQSPVIGH